MNPKPITWKEFLEWSEQKLPEGTPICDCETIPELMKNFLGVGTVPEEYLLTDEACPRKDFMIFSELWTETLPGIDESKNEFRFRVQDPSKFVKESFRRIPISEKKGIFAIAGKKPGKTTMEIQAYRFLKEKGWTREKVRDWLKGKKILAEQSKEIFSMMKDDEADYFINEAISERILQDVLSFAPISRDITLQHFDDSEYKYVIHLHETDSGTPHIDIRLETEGFVQTIILRSPFLSTYPVQASGKSHQAKGWLTLEDVEIESHKLKKIDEGVAEYGLETNDSIEIFLTSKEMKKTYVLSLKKESLSEHTIFNFATVNILETPQVLSGDKTPRPGFSALPLEVRQDVPAEFHYWNIVDNDEREKCRNEYIESLSKADKNLKLNTKMTFELSAISDNGEIRGIALREGTFHKILYPAEELDAGHESLVGKPLRLEHDPEKNIGEVLTAKYLKQEKTMPFTARVDDKEVREDIRNDKYSGVSVGVEIEVWIRWMDKEDKEQEVGAQNGEEVQAVLNGKWKHKGAILVARNLAFKELSITADPECRDCLIL